MARSLTGNNARREQVAQSRLLDGLVKRYRPRIRNEIRRAMNAAAAVLGNATKLKAVDKEHKRRMSIILTRLWKESGHDMSEHIDPGTKGRKAVSDDVTPTEVADRVMSEWILSTGATHVTEITDTTMNNIRKAIADGIENGLSEKEIAANIRAFSPTIADSRSQTIARTETHEAANVGAQATAKATGLKMVREWSASRGGRTRDTHADADGQKVGMNAKFKVGRASLRYPGDSSAGHPEETINCRCAVLFVLE